MGRQPPPAGRTGGSGANGRSGSAGRDREHRIRLHARGWCRRDSDRGAGTVAVHGRVRSDAGRRSFTGRKSLGWTGVTPSSVPPGLAVRTPESQPAAFAKPPRVHRRMSRASVLPRAAGIRAARSARRAGDQRPTDCAMPGLRFDNRASATMPEQPAQSVGVQSATGQASPSA